jgi:DNA-binding GntR family transcriptional regulator
MHDLWNGEGALLSDLRRRPGASSPLASLELYAYDRVKDAIITLALPPQATIVEGQFADRLGISKTPLRGALMQLEREGFVNSIPYKGSRVAAITHKQYAALYQLREAIEIFTVREGLGGCRNEELAALDDILQRQERSARQGDKEAANLLDVEFHRYFVERLGNPRLSEAYRNISDHRRRMRHALSGTRFDTTLTVSPKHWQRLDALRRRDLPAVEASLRDAIRVGLRLVQDADEEGVLANLQRASPIWLDREDGRIRPPGAP